MDNPASEDGRLARRASAKRRLARVLFFEHRCETLSRDIAEVELSKLRAADEHQRALQPVHAEIAEIERKQVDAVHAGNAIDPVLEARWLELLERIDGENAALQATVTAANSKIQRLTKARVRCGAESQARAEIDAELFDAGDPYLREKYNRLRIQGRSFNGETADCVYRQIINE